MRKMGLKDFQEAAAAAASEQPHLPDESFEPTAAELEIAAAAQEYITWRDERMACSAKEVEAKKRLQGIMDFHASKCLKAGKYIIELVPGEAKLKVKLAGDDYTTGDGPGLDFSDDDDVIDDTEQDEAA